MGAFESRTGGHRIELTGDGSSFTVNVGMPTKILFTIASSIGNLQRHIEKIASNNTYQIIFIQIMCMLSICLFMALYLRRKYKNCLCQQKSQIYSISQCVNPPAYDEVSLPEGTSNGTTLLLV